MRTSIHTHELTTHITEEMANRIGLAAARKRVTDEDITRRALDIGMDQIEAEIAAPAIRPSL